MAFQRVATVLSGSQALKIALIAKTGPDYNGRTDEDFSSSRVPNYHWPGTPKTVMAYQNLCTRISSAIEY